MQQYRKGEAVDYLIFGMIALGARYANYSLNCHLTDIPIGFPKDPLGNMSSQQNEVSHCSPRPSIDSTRELS